MYRHLEKLISNSYQTKRKKNTLVDYIYTIQIEGTQKSIYLFFSKIKTRFCFHEHRKTTCFQSRASPQKLLPITTQEKSSTIKRLSVPPVGGG